MTVAHASGSDGQGDLLMRSFGLAISVVAIAVTAFFIFRGGSEPQPVQARPQISLAELQADPQSSLDDDLARYRANQPPHWRAYALSR